MKKTSKFLVALAASVSLVTSANLQAAEAAAYPDLPCLDSGYACTNYGYDGTPGMYSAYAIPAGWSHNCTAYIGYVLTALYPYHDAWAHFTDAKNWNIDAAKAAVVATGVTISTSPSRFSVAQWNTGTGHVAWVEEVTYTGTTVSSIVVTEDNWSNSSSHRRIYKNSSYWPNYFINFGPTSGGGGGKPPVANIVVPSGPTQ